MSASHWSIALGDPTYVCVPGIAKPIACGSRERARLIAAAPQMLEALREADPHGDAQATIRALAHAALSQETLRGHQKEAIAGLLQQYARFLRVQRAALAAAEGA
jgi:hypothetical protein